jgi:hypothetical protein
MKSLPALLAALAAFAIQAAPLAADPVGPTPAHTDVFSIVHIFANNKGEFDALVMCKSATPVVGTYRLMLENGTGGFVKIKEGPVAVAKNQSTSIQATFKRTKGPQTLRLELSSTSPKAFTSRQVQVSSAKVYVLKYKTSGWVQVAYQFQKTRSELIGTAVQKPAADCRALGFKTRTRSEHTTVIFGTDSYRTYADARLDDYKEKTFDTKSERDKFERSLYKLVPSFTDDGNGLITRKSEREVTTQK